MNLITRNETCLARRKLEREKDLVAATRTLLGGKSYISTSPSAGGFPDFVLGKNGQLTFWEAKLLQRRDSEAALERALALLNPSQLAFLETYRSTYLVFATYPDKVFYIASFRERELPGGVAIGE